MTERWFTGSPSGALAVAPADFTELESKTVADILAFAQDPANIDWELMRCLDADGLSLHDESKGHASAPLTSVMKEAIRACRGVRLWHNHPSQDSLSRHDWICASTCPQVEVLALNESGSIFVGRMPHWEDWYMGVFKKLPVIAADLEFKISQLAKCSGLDIDIVIALSKLTGHVLNLAMKASGIGDYAYLLSETDKVIVKATYEKNVLSSGIEFASAEFRGMIKNSKSLSAST